MGTSKASPEQASYLTSTPFNPQLGPNEASEFLVRLHKLQLELQDQFHPIKERCPNFLNDLFEKIKSISDEADSFARENFQESMELAYCLLQLDGSDLSNELKKQIEFALDPLRQDIKPKLTHENIKDSLAPQIRLENTISENPEFFTLLMHFTKFLCYSNILGIFCLTEFKE